MSDYVVVLKSTRIRRARRRGVILLLTAFLMTFMIALLAFAIDLGYMQTVRTDIQRASDAAAFAGAGQLVYGTSAATTSALTYLGYNQVGGTTLGAGNAVITYGNWSTTSRTFTPSNNAPNAVKVVATASNQPLFFGKVLGNASFNMTSTSICVYQPRDIGIVLDYSGSMAFDSQFRNISILGQSEIEDNLQTIWQEMGSPKYGNLAWAPMLRGSSSTKNTDIIKYFKLDSVAYPYPSGSWSNFVDYVQTDYYVQAAGYQNKYGMMTFINYLQNQEPGASETPGLYAVSEQPVTALKDAVDVFLSYIQSVTTDDRIALSIYTFSDGTAKLESGLTNNYSSISTICRARQAGHYIGGTNISAGMTKARIELQNNARPGAKKMMIVMTDGVVNMPSGNTTSDKAACVTEANLAAAAGIPIVAVSLGAYADTALMQQLADITGGVAFVVPGGQPIAQVKTQLEQVFGQVAADRPLKLVQ